MASQSTPVGSGHCVLRCAAWNETGYTITVTSASVFSTGFLDVTWMFLTPADDDLMGGKELAFFIFVLKTLTRVYPSRVSGPRGRWWRCGQPVPARSCSRLCLRLP